MNFQQLIESAVAFRELYERKCGGKGKAAPTAKETGSSMYTVPQRMNGGDKSQSDAQVSEMGAQKRLNRTSYGSMQSQSPKS